MSLINKKIDIIANQFYKSNNSRFGRDFDVSDVTIRNYRLQKAPKFDFVLQLVQKLGINWEWLIHDKGDMINKNGSVEVQEPAPEYKMSEQLAMYREYIDTLKENNKMKDERIKQQQEQINELIKKLKKQK